jgi:hypothetical protein
VINAAGMAVSRNSGNLVAPFSRQPLDNVHPMIDSNKNIQASPVCEFFFKSMSFRDF